MNLSSALCCFNSCTCLTSFSILNFATEVHCTNDITSWSRCFGLDLLSWSCFEGTYMNLCWDCIFRAIWLTIYVIVQLTFPYNWSWKTSLLLGGLLSATDPVAVVALLKELGASKKLNTIIEGESLMNDGYPIRWFHSSSKLLLVFWGWEVV